MIRLREFSMSRWLLPSVVFFALVACSGPDQVAEFWRPISAPNLELPLTQEQKKLDFDLSQCRCGIYPANVTQPDLSAFQPDKERLAETSITITPGGDNGQCMQQPSLVVSECMRSRGWEVTNCSGRLPLAGGGSLCTAFDLGDP
jgi:hypothetical protein